MVGTSTCMVDTKSCENALASQVTTMLQELVLGVLVSESFNFAPPFLATIAPQITQDPSKSIREHALLRFNIVLDSWLCFALNKL